MLFDSIRPERVFFYAIISLFESMNDIWKNYKKVLHEKLDIEKSPAEEWARWSGKSLELIATNYKPSEDSYILKSREVEIWNDKTCIYNNIIYPRTGSNIPCLGVDLMMFFPKKVVIVFDFQHPQENYNYSVPSLPKCGKDIRFFEPGNHFSENLFIRKCTSEEVDNFLEDFTNYVNHFKNILEDSKPTGNDTSEYSDFDSYMTKLDPVAGYLQSNFGKEKTEDLVQNFLFEYQ
jgi:hypothetical protein